jgi:putative transposase
MDGKGCRRDNVFVERIWRTIKYEEVHLRAYESVHETKTSLGKYIEFYNQTRPHSGLKGKTPNEVHLNRLPEAFAA